MMRIMAKNPRMLKLPALFTQSYQDVITKYFKNDIVQQTMSFQSFYCGLPPELAPGFVATHPLLRARGHLVPARRHDPDPRPSSRVGEKLGMEVRSTPTVEKVMVRDRRGGGREAVRTARR